MSEFNDILSEKPAAYTAEAYIYDSAVVILTELARAIIDRFNERVPLASSPYRLDATQFQRGDAEMRGKILDEVRKVAAIDSIHVDMAVPAGPMVSASFVIRLKSEMDLQMSGNMLAIGDHAWNIITWKHYTVEQALVEDAGYVKLNMRCINLKGLSNDDREGGVTLRHNFRRMIRGFQFDTANLPAQVRDLLNRKAEGRFNIPLFWTKQYVPQDQAREFQDLFNDLAECQEEVGHFVAELYNGDPEDRENRIATVRLIPRAPVTGVCVFEYMVEILHLDI